MDWRAFFLGHFSSSRLSAQGTHFEELHYAELKLDKLGFTLWGHMLIFNLENSGFWQWGAISLSFAVGLSLMVSSLATCPVGASQVEQNSKQVLSLRMSNNICFLKLLILGDRWRILHGIFIVSIVQVRFRTLALCYKRDNQVQILQRFQEFDYWLGNFVCTSFSRN